MEKAKKKEIERVLKEKGIDGLTGLDRAIAEVYLNYEPRTFDKELYKKLPYTEKTVVYARDVNVEEDYKLMVLANRCLISGEKYKPFETLSDDRQHDVEASANGLHVRKSMEYLLELEYELKQKYNEEGDK